MLGSGWTEAVQGWGTIVASMPAESIPGFVTSGIPGHSGEMTSVRLDNGAHVLLIGARSHLYQGLGVDAVAHPVRTAAATGAKRLVLTNAAGGLNPAWRAGTLALIADQINLTGQTPLRGASFIDMTDAYSAQLRRLALSAAPGMPEGVYVQSPGPEYETPAESRMKRMLGGDMVGMSTALEAIAARDVGLEVLGLSLISNQVASASGTPVTHAEVLATMAAATPRMREVLHRVVSALTAEL